MNMGYLSAILYVLITTISSLFIEGTLNKLGNSLTILFLALVISSIFFNIIGFKLIKKSYSDVISDIKNYIIFCLFLGVSWICSVYGVQLSDALLFNISFFITTALAAFYKQYYQERSSIVLFRIICCIVILILTLINNSSLIFGFALGILGGVSSYLYRVTSVSFAQKKPANTLEIMMTRFIPIILILSFKVNFTDIANTFSQHYIGILIFSVISFIIPTYLSQYSNNHIGAEHSSIISALIFPLSWFGDLFVRHQKLNASEFMDLGLAITALLIIISPYIFKISYLKRLIKP